MKSLRQLLRVALMLLIYLRLSWNFSAFMTFYWTGGYRCVEPGSVSCSLPCLAVGAALLMEQWWASLGGKPSRMVGTGSSDHCTAAQPTLCLGMMRDTMLLIRQIHHRRGGRSETQKSDLPVGLQKVSGRRRSSFQMSWHPDLPVLKWAKWLLNPFHWHFHYCIWLVTVQSYSLLQSTPFLHLCFSSCGSVPLWPFTDMKTSLELDIIWKKVMYQGIGGHEGQAENA